MTKRPSDYDVWKAQDQRSVAGLSPQKLRCFELENYCAYNQTRECLLGSDVEAADFSVSSFKERIPIIEANFGTCLWLVPFRGIPQISEQAPLDLIYLDEHAAVIDVVESFPTFRVPKASQSAATVLLLPRHTIRSTQTQCGDQLLLCPTSEFSWRLLQLPGSTGNKLQSNDCTTRIRLNEEAPLTSHSMSRPSHGDDWDDRKKKNVMPVKNWLQRWWFPDLPEPRKASRESFPCLGAHFWTGCVPVKHEVRDISLTGLYVVTDERWSPGTQVRMTLTDSEESVVKNSITAVTSVVRWGNDGVGLTFVMRNEKQLQRGLTPAIGGIAMKDLNRFLVLARSGKRDRESREAHPMVSPSDRGEAIHSDANPGLHDLFIGPVNSSLLIGSLKDLPRPVSIAGSPILMNSHIKSHRRCPALYPQHL